MSISPPSPAPSTGMTSFTLGSALTEISLTAPVVRSATRAVLASEPMMSPLVESRQPCITPGAGQALGNGLAGSGGGGGGVDGAPGAISGGVVKGWDTALSKRAHPGVAPSTAATHSTARPPVIGRRIRMPVRLRTGPRYPPRRRSGAGRTVDIARRRRGSNPRFERKCTYAGKCDEPESRPRLAATRGFRGAAGVGTVGRSRGRSRIGDLRR